MTQAAGKSSRGTRHFFGPLVIGGLLAGAIVLLLFTADSPTAAGSVPESATRPQARAEEWWQKRFRRCSRLAAKHKELDLLFLGDSITEGWSSTGRDVWQEFYGRRRAVHMGISGDCTQHLLWRIQHGNLDGLAPKVVVLLIGTNNAGNLQHVAGEIAAGIAAIVKTLRARLPRTRILLLALLPRDPQPSVLRRTCRETSRLAAALADGDRVHFLDIGAAFLERDGSLKQSLMPDFLHPSAAGYRRMAEDMEPTLRRLLAEPLLPPGPD